MNISIFTYQCVYTLYDVYTLQLKIQVKKPKTKQNKTIIKNRNKNHI